jgi:Bacteriophage Sf6, terminase small subunit-like
LSICDAIAGGLSLTKAAAKFNLPAETVCRWTVRHPDFRQQYMQARETRTDLLAEQILDIADDGGQDWHEDSKGKKKLDREAVLRSRLRVDARQWQMARLDPRLWGEKQQLDVSANIMMLSPEERVQKALQLFDLMEKFVERARQPPMSDQPLVYDPGGDLPVLVVPNQKSRFGRD